MDIDDWIRGFSPKEEVRVRILGKALDIITNRERDAFETKLHNDIKVYEQEQIRPQSRGRRR